MTHDGLVRAGTKKLNHSLEREKTHICSPYLFLLLSCFLTGREMTTLPVRRSLKAKGNFIVKPANKTNVSRQLKDTYVKGQARGDVSHT